jgi:hypothetical protein
MKKLYAGLIFGIFMMSSFLAINLYTGTSFPGFGGSETCNNCHNQPILAKSVESSFQLGDWQNSKTLFEDNGLWSTNEVPTIPSNNRSAEIVFTRTQFLTNSSDFMMMMEIEDSTPTNTSTPSAISDKFAVIFNIDSVNFTVGDFLNTYTAAGNIDGQMGLKEGSADLWWIDTHDTGVNTTGTAMDYYITSNYVTDGADSQDVQFGLWWGLLATHGSRQVWGYRLYFVRSLTTSDTTHDVQFADGNAVRYAIATWDNAANEAHHSSFDQMLIVGDKLPGQAGSTGGGSAPSFTAIFVLAGLVVSVPVISHYKRRKE